MSQKTVLVVTIFALTTLALFGSQGSELIALFILGAGALATAGPNGGKILLQAIAKVIGHVFPGAESESHVSSSPSQDSEGESQ